MIWYTSHDEQTVQLVQDVLGSDMMVNRYAEAFSGPPIDDVQRAECAAIKQSIDRKIITPYMVFSFRTEPDAGLGQELARVCFKQRRGNWLILLP